MGLAEREGLPQNANGANKINSLRRARSTRVYQSCAPKSSHGGARSLSHPLIFAAGSRHPRSARTLATG